MAGELGDTEAFALRLQSLYLRHAYRFDDRAGLSNARIEPNLHQIYIAHLVTNKVQPRMILADEVGLGKTIEEIGNASCEERGCQYVLISGVGVTLKKKKT